MTSFLQERLAIENLSDERWSDLSCHTLTIDVGFHIANYYSKGEAVIDKYEYIFPLDGYSPNLTVSVWEELLHNPDVFTDKSLLVMKYIKDYGGHATCKQLSLKYGEDPMFYNSHSINLAKRICKVKNIKPDFNGDGSPCYWPVLYVGRYTHTGEDGDFVWKLRDELAEALDNMDKSQTVSIADKAENPIAKAENVKKYSKEDFLNDVFMNEKKYDTLVAVLRNKKNIILQGAPGVGKTYAARRLAYSIMGEEDKERVQLVQFHQNYSYEDFIMGYKPTEDGGFELRSGVFYRFCQKASNQPEKEFFFIIDEINRGNMSKIFGELLMLIEKDYRGERMTLGHEGKTLLVPENLYIIGMMNTADRSLAMIDYALRRRFSFVEMEPAFDSEGFRRYQESLNNETFNRLIEEIVELNGKITEDKSLGKGFCIGHSYFCNWDECTKEKMQEVVDFDIIPTLEEYWFDEPDEVQKWGDILHGVVR